MMGIMTTGLMPPGSGLVGKAGASTVRVADITMLDNLMYNRLAASAALVLDPCAEDLIPEPTTNRKSCVDGEKLGFD